MKADKRTKDAICKCHSCNLWYMPFSAIALMFGSSDSQLQWFSCRIEGYRRFFSPYVFCLSCSSSDPDVAATPLLPWRGFVCPTTTSRMECSCCPTDANRSEASRNSASARSRHLEVPNARIHIITQWKWNLKLNAWHWTSRTNDRHLFVAHAFLSLFQVLLPRYWVNSSLEGTIAHCETSETPLEGTGMAGLQNNLRLD